MPFCVKPAKDAFLETIWPGELENISKIQIY